MPSEIIPVAADLPHGLGRHINHDERSRQYRVTADVPIESVSWERRVPIFDQGQLGSCTGNAAAGWLATDNADRQGLTMVDVDGARLLVDEALAVDIYSQATQIDPWPGAWPPEDTGSDGLSVAKVLQSLGTVDVYRHAFTVEEAMAALQTGPVMIGSNWYDGMFYPNASGEVTISGRIVGGHEYLAVAYDKTRQRFRFANSWGSSWGDAGYFTMTLFTLSTLLSQDGDVTAPHSLIVAPVPPEPPAPPVPDEKPSWWNQVLEWINRLWSWLERERKGAP